MPRKLVNPVLDATHDVALRRATYGTQLAVRLRSDERDFLDAEAERISEETGLRVTASDVVRRLVAAAKRAANENESG